MTPPKKARVVPTPQPPQADIDEAWEYYASQARDDREELLAQPWASAEDAAGRLGPDGEVMRIEDERGGIRVTEGGRTRTIRPGAPAGAMREAEAGDTFTKTIYSEGGISEGYLNDDARVIAMRQSVIMYRDDPMYRAVIDGFVFFIIGKGLKFKARDENPVVQQHLQTFWTENKMDGRDAEIVRRFLKFGEVLLRYYDNGANGAPASAPRVRLVPFWQIDELKWDANDPETLVSAGVTPYDHNHATAGVPEPVPAAQLQYLVHSENSASRGEPPFLVIMRACKWYADFILNRVTLNRFRTAYVLFKKVKGGPGRVSTVDSGTPQATRKGANGQLEKRLPKFGTVVTHNEGVEYEWKNPDTGAGDATQDLKDLRHYIAAGGMVPEFLLGDASQANQDNSLVADNPFVRKVEYYQDLFAGVFGEMFRRVLQQGIAAGKIPKTSTETALAESGAVLRAVRRVLRAVGLSEADAAGQVKRAKNVPTKLEVDIDWPTLIQKNEYEQVKTLQIDQVMGTVSVETIRAKRGYDHEVEAARLDKEAQAEQDRFAAQRDDELDAPDDEDAAVAAANGHKGGKQPPQPSA